MVFMKPTFSGFTWVLPHHYSNSATGDWLKRWCSAQFTLTKQVVGKKDQTTKKKDNKRTWSETQPMKYLATYTHSVSAILEQQNLQGYLQLLSATSKRENPN